MRTHLNISGGKSGTYSFQVANPTSSIPFNGLPAAPRTPGDAYSFHSNSIRPAAVRMSRTGGSGDIFVGPQQGPISRGPEILDRNGHVVWYKPAPANDNVMDFRVQTYRGHPVLTWWQGNVNAGTGRGTDYIYDSHYRQVATVRAGNGLSADLHEFKLTSANTALITAYYPVYVDARSVHRPAKQIVLDSVVQEIDVPTGLVLFQWDSLDHVPLTDSRAALPARRTRNPFDYFHINSIDVDHDGNLVISGRNTWAAYKLSRQSGQIIWTLGGRHSTFKLGAGATFAFQHDVRIRSGHDWYVTLFDDGGGPPEVHQSRALELFLDMQHRTRRASSSSASTVPRSRRSSRATSSSSPTSMSSSDGVGRRTSPNTTGTASSCSTVGSSAPTRATGRIASTGPAARCSRPRSRRRSGASRTRRMGELERGDERLELARPRRQRARPRWPRWRTHAATGSRPRSGPRRRRAVAVEALDRAGHVLGKSAVVTPR